MIPDQIRDSLVSEVYDHDFEENDGSSVTSKLVPSSEFGTFVSKHHAHGNKEFIRKFEV